MNLHHRLKQARASHTGQTDANQTMSSLIAYPSLYRIFEPGSRPTIDLGQSLADTSPPSRPKAKVKRHEADPVRYVSVTVFFLHTRQKRMSAPSYM